MNAKTTQEKGSSQQLWINAAQNQNGTLPEKTEPVNNPIGTAPGVRVDLDETVLFALPGVPKEMEAIFMESIAPLFKQYVGDRVFCEKSLFLDNIMESHLAPLIDRPWLQTKGFT